MFSRICVMTLFALALAACSVSIGSHKDLATGLTVSYSGLTVDESYLTVDKKKLSSNEVSLGSIVYLVLTGVGNFTETAGKVYPGASMNVTGSSGQVVIDEKDLFARYDTTGVESTGAGNLSLNLTVAKPMSIGETYVWKARVWDKKGKGEINAEMKVKVK
jgi:hypothetical protein